jgi:hypothetical protein
MAPMLTLVLALIWRIDRPAASRKRSTSRIFRIVILLADMAPPGKAGEDIKQIQKQCVEKDSGRT